VTAFDRASSVRGSELIGLAVRWHGVRLGSVEDAILDRELTRLVGLVVAIRGGEPSFLAFGACRLAGDIEPDSPLALLEPQALFFYRAHGVSLLSLRDATVTEDGREVGTLGDLRVDGDGVIISVAVAHGDTEVWLPSGTVEIRLPSSRAAGVRDAVWG
jgi:sporulation protein YlmC with PRC-barrel domain